MKQIMFAEKTKEQIIKKIETMKQTNFFNQWYKQLSIGALLLLSMYFAKANNLNITNLSITGSDTVNDYMTVQFDIGWENSWRLSTEPNNWDAAWVFVKYRIDNGWQHATLNYVDGTAANDGHTEPTGASITTPNDGKGIFIYRNADGTGNVNWTGVQLRWNYAADTTITDADVFNDNIDIQIFGVEMVYVNEGTFAYGGFPPSHTINTPDATVLPSGNGGIMGSPQGGYTSSSYTPYNANWPNGYHAFYCMKYEVSQGQYADFLNTLTPSQMSTRAHTTSNYGHTIKRTTDGYIAEVPDRACNYISWVDCLDYADWAALRPMTELEFEKACRGPKDPVDDEYAWGHSGLHAFNYTLSDKGLPAENINNMAINTGNALYASTDDSIQRPVRCGLFAASAVNKSREETGATYYGIMEMSGNLAEHIIQTNSGSTYHRRFTTETNGDGVPSNVVSGSEFYGLSGSGTLIRGGAWNQPANYLEISIRPSSGNYDDRREYIGFRGVRTAP